MENRSIQIPNTFEELEIELAKHKPLDSNNFHRCHCCKVRDYHDNMRGVQYKHPTQGFIMYQAYFCKKCVGVELYDFILLNGIQVQTLNARQIKNLQSAFYSGEYDCWLRGEK